VAVPFEPENQIDPLVDRYEGIDSLPDYDSA